MRRRFDKSYVKSMGSTHSLHKKLPGLSMGEVSGISGVAVKCVDIGRNISGESGFLDQHRRSGTKAWGANRIRYPGSPRPKRCELDVGLNSEISVEANALSSPPGEYGRKTETQRN